MSRNDSQNNSLKTVSSRQTKISNITPKIELKSTEVVINQDLKIKPILKINDLNIENGARDS